MNDTLIAALFTVIGAIIGGVTSYYVGIIKSARDSKIIAGTKLRASFAHELAILKCTTNSDKETCAILEDAFIKHQIAVDEFCRHLSGNDIIRFNDVWLQYHGYKKNDQSLDIKFFAKYFIHNNINGRKEAINNIEQILSFAQPDKYTPFYKKIISKIHK